MTPEGDIEQGGGSTSSERCIAKQEALALVQIQHKEELRLSLADWEERVRVATSRIERKESLSNHVKNEIYQLVGFYIVFQGVILTTLSQSNNLRCETWWFPFALSAIATVVTLGGVVLKSFDYLKWRNGAKKVQSDAKVLKERIAYMKRHGEKFDFAKHAGNTLTVKNSSSAKDRIIKGIFVFLVFSLIGFAAVILHSCRAILCPSTASRQG